VFASALLCHGPGVVLRNQCRLVTRGGTHRLPPPGFSFVLARSNLLGGREYRSLPLGGCMLIDRLLPCSPGRRRRVASGPEHAGSEPKTRRSVATCARQAVGSGVYLPLTKLANTSTSNGRPVYDCPRRILGPRNRGLRLKVCLRISLVFPVRRWWRSEAATEEIAAAVNGRAIVAGYSLKT
jgi:hypothetical protein